MAVSSPVLRIWHRINQRRKQFPMEGGLNRLSHDMFDEKYEYLSDIRHIP